MISYSIRSETLSQRRYLRIGVMCWNSGACTTVRARAFWMCWRRFIWNFRRQRGTAVELGVHNGGGNCFGGMKVKTMTDTAKSTDVLIAGSRLCRDLVGEWEMFVKYEAKVASRLGSVYRSRRVVSESLPAAV